MSIPKQAQVGFRQNLFLSTLSSRPGNPRRLHLRHPDYFYHQHPVFGFMHLRLQTWFPFQVEVCLNGREWLVRQLERAGLPDQRQDNYVAWVPDGSRAQALLDRQHQAPWRRHRHRLLAQNHPLHRGICTPLDGE